MTEEIVLGGLSPNQLAKAALGLFSGQYEAYVTLMETQIPDGSSDGDGGPAVYLFQYPIEKTKGYARLETARQGCYKVVNSIELASDVMSAVTDARVLLYPGLLEDPDGRQFLFVMPEYYIDDSGQFVELRQPFCDPFNPPWPDNFPIGIHLAKFHLVPVPLNEAGRPICKTAIALVKQFRRDRPNGGMSAFRTWLFKYHQGSQEKKTGSFFWMYGETKKSAAYTTIKGRLYDSKCDT